MYMQSLSTYIKLASKVMHKCMRTLVKLIVHMLKIFVPSAEGLGEASFTSAAPTSVASHVLHKQFWQSPLCLLKRTAHSLVFNGLEGLGIDAEPIVQALEEHPLQATHLHHLHVTNVGVHSIIERSIFMELNG